MKKAGIFAFWVLGLVIFRPAAAEEIDRLLAAVNGRVITEGDLKLWRSLNALILLGRSDPDASRQQELSRRIDLELIQQEMESFLGQAGPDNIQAEVEAKMSGLRSAYAEIGGLPELLRRLGLQEKELVAYIRLILLSNRFSNLRFGPFVTVSTEEVEAYYREKLLPILKKSGASIPPLQELTPRITDTLKQEKITIAMENWIQNIREHSRIEFFPGSGRASGEERR